MKEKITEFNKIFEGFDSFREYIITHTLEEMLDLLSVMYNMNMDVLRGYLTSRELRNGKKASYLNCLTDLKDNIEYYRKVYDLLYDEESKKVYFLNIAYRFFPVKAFLNSSFEEKEIESGATEIIKDNIVSYIINNKNNLIAGSSGKSFILSNALSDMWEVPLLLEGLLPEYRYYIRNKEKEDFFETILTVLPYNKKDKKKNALKTAVTFVPHQRFWNNVELVKDSGVLPYLLYKDHGMDVTMVGFPENMDEYSYAGLVTGMRLQKCDHYDFEYAINYLMENAKKIDLLILRGGYDISKRLSIIYKSLNPNGIIYCGLDANSWWMDQIIWDTPDYRKFLEYTDFMATSCTAMAEHLTQKWHKKINVVFNGYYDFFDDDLLNCRYEDKENIIFTASRLGTEQKRTDVLLMGFAFISKALPDWKLRLAGDIDGSFKPFIDKYFETYPLLKERVTFLGRIDERKKLAEEYKRAKIFALPSSVEGGAPNVIAEALFSGCVIAVSDIDAYEDCIDGGKCGKVSKTGDAKDFARSLVELCYAPNLREMSESAKEYAKEKFDMKKIVDEVYAKVIDIREGIE